MFSSYLNQPAERVIYITMGALNSVKVLEFSEFISGPYCAKMLGDMGADVIKIEEPGTGDSARLWGPFPQNQSHLEKSGVFLFLNTNKSSITLDVEKEKGQQVFRRLVKWAEVLIIDKTQREMTKLGLEYPKLKKINPSLIVTSITPFGQTGPYKDYKGNDLINSHMSSEAFGNPAEGVDDREKYSPLRGPMHAADFMTGLTAALCTMSAIYTSQRNKNGRFIDISAQESLASVTRQELAFCLCEGLYPTRQQGRKRVGGFLYKCKDGYVCIWLGPHWQKLVTMMGKPDWTEVELFKNAALRSEHQIDCNKLIELWTLQYTTAEIDRMGIEFDVPLAPVRNVKDLVNDEQLVYRNFFVEIDHPEAGTYKYPGAPYKLSATPWAIKHRAPLLGEHNTEVYGRVLGYKQRDIEAMTKAGII